ncbi:MAG TPA: serine/threonine-protein kinase [Polyangiaceae bacterium]|nr:serine/threonine-protein kinase [Polyangiaceae bacterium]
MTQPVQSPPRSPHDTLPPLDHVSGWLCVSCRRVFPQGHGGEGERCPFDGGTLVAAQSYARAGADPMLGRTMASGRYTILARLGAGAMGTVYRARQEGTGRDVALKILRRDRAFDSASKARFEREARANSALVSAHTVTVYDFGQAEDGSLYLAMELLDGESLGDRLRERKRLPPDQAVRITCDALRSLSEAHRKGIIHRDIKPDNLFLARRPSPDGKGLCDVCTVLDFGIAKVREQEGIKAVETQAGMVFGTPRYMSPEQAQGRALDARSDLYSLGVILYQMLVGRPPFEEDEAVLVMARHIKTQPKPPRQVAPGANIPEALERLVMRSLSKSPNDRPADADQFRLELERMLPAAERAALETTAAVLTSETTRVTSAARRPGVIALVLTLLLAGLALAALFGRESGPPSSPRVASSAGGGLPPASAFALPSAPPVTSDGVPVVPLEALPTVDDGKGGSGAKPNHGRPPPPRAPRAPSEGDVPLPSPTPSTPYRR